MDDVKLPPVFLLHKAHQLTAAEVADTRDEVGPGRLLGNSPILHVIELRGTVHRETPGPSPQDRSQQCDISRLVQMVGMEMLHFPIPKMAPSQNCLRQVEQVPEMSPDARPGQGQR